MKSLPRLLSIGVVLAVTGCATHPPDSTATLSSPQRTKSVKGRFFSKPAVTRQQVAKKPESPVKYTDYDASTIWGELNEHVIFANDIPDSAIGPQIKRFSNNQAYFDRTLERAERYLPYVLHRVLEADLPAEIALLPFIESAYNPFAHSPSGAAGLWQFIPSTGDSLHLTRNYWYDGRRDIIRSTDAAILYLKTLNASFDGDWLLTLAAYNAGPGTVQRAIEANARKGKKTDFWSLGLRSETRRYVPRLVALTKVIAHPDSYGVELKAIPREAELRVVDLQKPVDLTQAAKLAGITTDQMYHLNPGYTRWVTPPTGPHQLVLPSDGTENFKEKLASLTDRKWQPLQEYQVGRGDTLSRIASRHHLSVAELVKLNKITSTGVLKVGQVLLVPSEGHLVATSSSSVLKTYKVKAGDNLWTIAKSHNIKLKDLLVWNNISTKATLKPGQELKFYPSDARRTAHYKVQSGDSLYTIAKRHKVSLKDLLAWNNLSKSSLIKPGQLLKVELSSSSQ